MENKFTQVMSERTDEQLIKIVTIDRDGYEPIAVEAAEQEIQKRKIDIAKVDEVKIDLIAKLKEDKEIDSNKVHSFTRFLHYLIDSFVIFILAMILSFIVGLFINLNSLIIAKLIIYAMMTITFFAYYIYMEYRFEKTIGKIITKTKVVNKNGHKAELGDIIRRTFSRIIPLEGVSFLFTINGLHDYLSETIVIKDSIKQNK